jgi:predicted small lipoprotein YifL
MSRLVLLLATGHLMLPLCGCGLKGDLYLPEKSPAPIVITAPVQSASSSVSSSSNNNPAP